MIDQLFHITRLQWFIFFSIAIVVALVYSPVVLSLGMIGLLLTTLLEPHPEKKSRLQLRRDFGKQWQSFKREPQFWVVTILFLLPLLGGLYSEDVDYLFRRLRLKLPCLLLPFAFFIAPIIKKRHYLGIYYFLLILLTLTCIGVGIHYSLHFDSINAALLKGQAVPVPRNHIRFSLLMAIGILGGGYLFAEKYVWKKDWERYLILGMTLFLFGFIHVLSVRSGLLVLYTSICVLLVQYIYKSRRFLLGGVGLVMLVALPFLAYHTVPSFKGKIDYMRWDWKMYQAGEGAQYSDAGRLISYEIGWSIVKDYPILGVGTGDLKPEVHRRYAERFPSINKPKMPHNQWLSVWAAHGLVGLLIFIGAFFVPLFYKKHYQHPLLLAFYTIFVVAFMLENTIEASMGLGIFLFFLLWNLKYLFHNKKG